MLAHPPYSPELPSCNFYLFSKIKENVREQWFTDREEAVAAYEKTVDQTPSASGQSASLSASREVRRRAPAPSPSEDKIYVRTFVFVVKRAPGSSTFALARARYVTEYREGRFCLFTSIRLQFSSARCFPGAGFVSRRYAGRTPRRAARST
ncbi:hypothetical protein EVAR_59309_1 [Eumeta japonica]|uniref:Histone-lysine N-methyltransferase SETMAR n=1 Tax=Eumeta variegata TaxID=151549 RepID=A0A4C1YDS4_EUMVA|nr:hypothetical protein EVAR_59309_1 [Eumeta japonica]